MNVSMPSMHSLPSIAPGRRRVAAVTSAATGAGRAIAQAYADAGWDVALIGRGWAGLEAAAEDVRRRGRAALVLPIDVTDDAARQLAIQRIQNELGPIEAWVADGLVPRYSPRRLRYPRRSRRMDEIVTVPGLRGPAVAAVAGAVVLGLVVSRFAAPGRR